MTYFTPLHAILEDIKRVTKAEDVRLAEPHRQSPLQPIDNQLGMVIGFPEQCSTPVHTPDSVSPPDSGIDVSSTPEAMSNKRKSQDSDLSEESPTKKINYNIEEAAESILV